MTDDEIERRKEQGRQAAREAQATELKPTGQTSSDNYPYTYWYMIGYNEAVEEMANE